MTAAAVRLACWLAALARGHRGGRCGCLGCRKAERDARAAIGMPLRHPERITGGLPGQDEEWLAGLADALWPDEEYAEIIIEIRRREDRP